MTTETKSAKSDAAGAKSSTKDVLPLKTSPTVSDFKIAKKTYDGVSVMKSVLKAYPELKWTEADQKHLENLLPDDTCTLTYSLKGINTDLANGWRRIVLDELKYPRFTVRTSDIKGNDEFVQHSTEYIQNRLWLIPVSYIPAPSGAQIPTWEINVTNTTSSPIVVTSADIKPVVDGKETKAVSSASSFTWSKNQVIHRLLPGKSMEMKITIEWGIGLQNASFTAVGPVYYDALGYPEPRPSATTVYVRDYHLGFRCSPSLIDPAQFNLLAWRTFEDKLLTAVTNLEKVDKVPYNSPDLRVYKAPHDAVTYAFERETLTLTRTIAWYVFYMDPSIARVNAGDEHPEYTFTIVTIQHKDHTKVMIAAAREALADIRKIIKAF